MQNTDYKNDKNKKDQLVSLNVKHLVIRAISSIMVCLNSCYCLMVRHFKALNVSNT